MDLFFSYLIYFVLFSVSLAIIHLANSRLRSSSARLPPGRTGWPVIGEILEFAFALRTGQPERFIKDRMDKYSPEVFRTSLMGENMAVMCGASGNRFLFSNEDKLVSSWWPSLMKKILYSPSLFDNPPTEDLMRPSSSVHEFLKPEALKHYAEIMDMVARKHIDMYWTSKEEVKVYPLSKKYTFDLSCRLFMNIEDPEVVAKISDGFDRIMAGFLSLPINIPGTAFNNAIKARNNLHKQIGEIIRKRKKELTESRESNSDSDSDSAAHDLLSRMLLMRSDENIEVPSELEITTRINAMILASHETSSTAITFALWYLAEFPEVYDAVLKEQMEIAKSKGPEEYLLNWNDIQKMKYSWNVARESMRLASPSHGTFREAIADFTYAGFTIPKGWKIHWSVHSTHKNREYFPDPEKFDPSRFEGKGPPPYTFVPFGGGPHMCLGKEYARVEILVFIYNVVTRFKLKKVNPNEKITCNPAPTPANGLPVRLHPHQMLNIELPLG